MNSISKILVVILLSLSTVNGFAQIKNIETVSLTINGNCGMCKKNIEHAGNADQMANVVWDKESKLAVLTYHSDKTNPDEILKRIALAGYDSEQYLAPDDVYAKLPECCQYNRDFKPVSTTEEGTAASKSIQKASPLSPVFDHYFLIKEALVKTNAGIATENATQLAKAIKDVDMSKLSTAEHAVWMKQMKSLMASAEKMAGLKEVSKQRETFVSLSTAMYELAKVSKLDAPIYQQHCPMYADGKGANWLSRESAIKNPYYGTQMLTCGSLKETIGN
jgi:hypothetical protein